jgi:hypothetical protein
MHKPLGLNIRTTKRKQKNNRNCLSEICSLENAQAEEAGPKYIGKSKG